MAQTEQTDTFAFVRETGGIHEYELKSNGLHVLLMEDHSAPVATVMVNYQVGSRHETEGLRGSAHLLEHMMFKGTEKYQKAKGTAIARVLQSVGAHLNATTWQDGTNYYETIPSDHLDVALDIESQRMRGSLFKAEDLASEMHVVHSELEKIENSPITMLHYALWGEAFKTHPYHYPVIGFREDIEAVTSEDLHHFYDLYYWPNNAYLTIIGDFNTAETLEKISHFFGSVPRSSDPVPSMNITEPAQNGFRHTEVRREDQLESVMVAHKIPGMTHPDIPALDLLCQILSSGKNSRLYRLLVDSGLAVEVRTDISKSHDPGLLITHAVAAPETAHDDLQDLILAAYRDIAENGVTETELTNAKNMLEANLLFSRDGSFAMASDISEAISGGDWTFFVRYPEKIREVSAADVQTAAAKYLVDSQMTTAYLISKNTQMPAKKNLTGADKNAFLEEQKAGIDTEPAASAILTTASAQNQEERFNLSYQKRIASTEENGIKVMSIQTGLKDAVTLVGSFDGAGYAYSDDSVLPSLVVNMLEEGTLKHNRFEIAGLLESIGASIAFDLDQERVGFKAMCLKKDIPLVINLIAEQLREPAFDAQEFEKQKQRLYVDLIHIKTDTASQAAGELSRILYPKKHPYHDEPTDEQLKKLQKIKQQDLVKFHQEHFGPQQMIIVAAGDTDHNLLSSAVREAFAGWTAKTSQTVYPKPDAEKKGVHKQVKIAEKSKVDIVMGHVLPLKRLDPDYYAAFLANYILGGDFSARLSNTVRDELGLTYSIYSEFSGLTERHEGHWMIHLIVNPKVVDRGISETLKQLTLFADEGISENELIEEKKTLIGRFKVSLSTSEGTAWRILTSEQTGLGLGYLDDYPSIIGKITLSEVNTAVKKLFHPDRLSIVSAGTFAKQTTDNKPETTD
ncbi:MAG: insulinase family protein [Candidatus Omnitrophica bacterium]|nr:insulinase family protein [Candidatus Omnitrophota bacterium]